MGLEVLVPQAGERSLEPALERLRAEGITTAVLMVDGALTPPHAPLPRSWRDVRLRTPAGMLTVVRRPDGVAVVVFGNADEALREAQQKLVTALSVG